MENELHAHFADMTRRRLRMKTAVSGLRLNRERVISVTKSTIHTLLQALIVQRG